MSLAEHSELTATNASNEEYVAALESAVMSLAAIYGDHPDYRQEWKP